MDHKSYNESGLSVIRAHPTKKPPAAVKNPDKYNKFKDAFGERSLLKYLRLIPCKAVGKKERMPIIRKI